MADDAFGVALRPLIGGRRAALGGNLAIPGHWQKADSWICFIPERNGQFDRPVAIETFVRVVIRPRQCAVSSFLRVDQRSIHKLERDQV